MLQAVNLINDSPDLLLVILNGTNNAHGRIESVDVGDLRRKEVVHTLTRRTIYQIIGGMLVCPRSMAARRLHSFKDGVGSECGVRIQRHTFTIYQPARQLGGIDHIE